MVEQVLTKKKARSSNIELFRIFLMLMIIAHHYTTSSGLNSFAFNNSEAISFNRIFLLFYGGGGKIGINCFLLITGYFMCKQEFKWKKLLKLILEIKFYDFLFYTIFLFSGYTPFSIGEFYKTFFSISFNFGKNFPATFIVLYVLIPYINIFIKHLTHKEFNNLLIILLTIFSGLSMCSLHVEMITWYIVVYLIGAYLRLYPHPSFNNRKKMALLAVGSLLLSWLSIAALVVFFHYIKMGNYYYYFVSNSNHILSISTAVAFFLFFKSIKMPTSRIINKIATATFGVLLIHGNSAAMRHFIWGDIFRNVDFVNSNYLWLHAFTAVMVVYLICVVIDLLRIQLLEKPLFKLINKKCPVYLK